MNLDEAIRHRQDQLKELEVRYTAAMTAQQQFNAVQAHEMAIAPSPESPQIVQTQTYEVPVPPPVPPQAIQGQIEEVKASLEVLLAQAELEKLRAGPSVEEVQRHQPVNIEQVPRFDETLTGQVVEAAQFFKQVQTPASLDGQAYLTDPTPHPDPVVASAIIATLALDLGAKQISDTAKDIGESAIQKYETAKQDIKESAEFQKAEFDVAKEMAKEIYKDAAEKVKDHLEAAKQDLKDSAEFQKLEFGVAKEMVKEVYKDAVEKAKDIADSTKDMVKESLEKAKDLVMDVARPADTALEIKHAQERAETEAKLAKIIEQHKDLVRNQSSQEQERHMALLERQAQEQRDDLARKQAEERARAARQMDDPHRF
jgi:hypothetical protein